MKKIITAFFTLIISLFACAASANGFCVGDKVVLTTKNGKSDVKIIAVYPDGTADVNGRLQGLNTTTHQLGFDTAAINVSLTQLSWPITSLNGFSVNDAAIVTHSGAHAQVRIVDVFRDGTADVTSTEGLWGIINVSLSELSKPILKFGDFRVGDILVRTFYVKSLDIGFSASFPDGYKEIVSLFHSLVQINAVYLDGTADVSYTKENRAPENVSVSELSLPMQCDAVSCEK